MAVTIYDIAKAVGFSPSTVSKALNGRRDVGGATRAKVIKAASAMGYAPNVHARGLKMNKSWLVGLVYDEDAHVLSLDHPLFLPVINAFKQRMELYGYELLFLSHHSRFACGNLLSHASSRQIDGLLLMSFPQRELSSFNAASRRIPAVSCDSVVPGILSVVTDNMGAASQAVRYLYDLGHRRIAHVAGPSDKVATAGDERLVGYREGLASCGLPCDEALIARAKGWTPEDGRDAFVSLLDRNTDMSAVFCSADFYVMGLLQICRDRNIDIPRDLSVIGFDDAQWTSFLKPGFTTFRQNKEQLGTVSAEMLIEAMEGTSRDEIMRIDAQLIQRGSCARLHIQ